MNHHDGFSIHHADRNANGQKNTRMMMTWVYRYCFDIVPRTTYPIDSSNRIGWKTKSLWTLCCLWNRFASRSVPLWVEENVRHLEMENAHAWILETYSDQKD